MREDNHISTDPVQEWARKFAGIPFLFPVQRMVIAGILDALYYAKNEQSDDFAPRGQIAVMPTGAGKSLCFQIPTALIPGPVLVLYPLLALLQDQKRRFDELGIPAAVLRGGQSIQERAEIWRAVKNGTVRAILSNPESMTQTAALAKLKEMKFLHLIVDESHCICEWGKTFRPAYLEIPKIQKEARIPVLSAFTATAGPQVLKTIRENLFPGYAPQELIGSPDRPNMAIRIMGVVNKNACIVEMFRSEKSISGGTSELPMWTPGEAVPRPAIVFCSSRKGAEQLSERLSRDHHDRVHFYHAGLERQIKDDLERWFFSSDDGILVSTCAYGMGVDKKNIRSVIHRDLSQSIESYIQEAGRGGRDRKACQAILLVSPSDLSATRRMPKGFQRERLQQLLDWIQEPGCRRRNLLKQMDCEPAPCFACSSCCQDSGVAPNSYWARMPKTVRKMIKCRNLTTWDKELLVQNICSEYEWDRFEIPPLWMRSFPGMPEWKEDEFKSVLSEIIQDRRTQKGFLKLINTI